MWLLIIIFSVVVIGLFYYVIFLKNKLQHLREEEVIKTEGRRSAFISIISHQLRTPLSIIKGYLESLLAEDLGKITTGQKEYLSEALDINIDTVKLVNDYLNIVKLDSEYIEVDPKPVDLVSVVEEEVHRIKPLAKASNCEVVFHRPGGPIPMVRADLIKIKQVVQNTLSNAIKYIGGHGQAVLIVENKGETVQFSCHDTGVGIPKEQQSEIFTKFFRARNVINKNTKGSGLGLYLAKMIIDALGGKIWLKSEENKGTTIYFELPIYKNGKK
ncbi:MAG: HAMP domain-containing sensor histidine kinase [Patescibacteria group bacterium]|jgi:signal transduction histidine kinase